jgi:hypothetical protein
MFGTQYEQEGIDWNKNWPEKQGDKYLVVEHNYLKKEKITREHDPVTGVTIWEWMDEDQRRQIIAENLIDEDRLQKIDVYDDVQYIYTFVPGLTNQFPLLDVKSEFQLGRLNFFPWSTDRGNGKPLPMVDQLRDAQMEINKRISTISHIAESVLTTGTVVDEAIFGMDESKKREFEQNYNNPRKIHWMAAGMSRQFPNAIRPVMDRQIPGDLFGIANMMVDLYDRLVPQPAASEGRTERSGESGILFAQKVEVAKTMQTTLMASIRQLWNDIGEAYFFMSKQLYGKGRRVFTSGNGMAKTVVNEEYINEYGETVVYNDFSGLSRHRVIVGEAPAGVNNRLAQMELNGSLAQNYAQLAPNASLTFIENLIGAIDMDEMMKENARQAISLDRENLAASTKAAIMQSQATMKQIEGLMQQAQGPQVPQGGQPGEGLPPPQEALPSEAQEAVTEIPSGLDNPATEQRLATYNEGGQGA